MPEVLDIARFNLDAMNARAKIHIDLMKAYADFNYRMAEVAEKRVAVARRREELRQLKQAYKEYQTALKEVKRERNKLERQEVRINRAARNAERLSWGEWLDPDLVGLAWTGFRFLVNQMHGQLRVAVFGAKINGEHRLGVSFSRNRYPNSPCDDAPGTIRNAISLFEWARRKSYIPRVGTPPQESLGAILTILHDNAETELTQLTKELVNARVELTKLRMVNWRKVGIAEHPPKNPKS